MASAAALSRLYFVQSSKQLRVVCGEVWRQNLRAERLAQPQIFVVLPTSRRRLRLNLHQRTLSRRQRQGTQRQPRKNRLQQRFRNAKQSKLSLLPRAW